MSLNEDLRIIKYLLHAHNMYVMNKNININMIVSGIIMKAYRRSEEFKVNRPFLYAIVAAQRDGKTDKSNPLTLFSGRIFMPK